MIYQHPLAYLLGLEGIALLRAWAGDFDQDFVDARLAEVRALLEDPLLALHPGVEVWRGDVDTGYGQWADSYDEPNGLFDIEEPDGEFRAGALDQLPADENSADLVVCALALAHVPTLHAVMAEFSRVLRPGGHLVISDAHHELVFRGSVVKVRTANGEPGLVVTYRHTTGDFLRAALPAGFLVRRCEEPRGVRAHDERPPGGPTISDAAIGTWDDWPWSLLEVIPDAARAAWATPSVIAWHFELGSQRDS
jgi:SAM-dependent methyltransferase